jgi:hypothetical protein
MRRGFPLEEAIKVIPVRESVKAFSEASWFRDWVGEPIDDVYETYCKWCISNGYDSIEVSKQGFSRQLLSLYPNLKTVPTKCVDGYKRIVRERR